MAKEENKDCFVIMPIADCEGCMKKGILDMFMMI